MVGVKKFSALAVFSAVAVTGAMASLQPADASHAHHHRGLAERQFQPHQQSSMIKVQKRLVPGVSDAIGGILAGGAPASSGSVNSAPPASATRAAANHHDASANHTPASTKQAASASPKPANSQPANNNANNNNKGASRPSSAAANNGGNRNNNNNNGSNRAASNTQNNNANQSPAPQQQQQQASVASTVPTDTSSAAAAASASAASAAASAISANSASQASANALASSVAATAANSATSAAGAAVTTGANLANSNKSSSNSSDGTTKVVVPIVVIVGSIALIGVAAFLIRRYRNRKAEDNDLRSYSVDKNFHHRSMVAPPLAAGGAAFAVGGAAAGLTRDRPRRDSYESFHNGRPMSNITEQEGDFSGVAPPMQEVAPYAAVGSAYGTGSSRMRNYGSARDGDFPPAHRITDSMYVDDMAAGRAVTPFSDEHGAYDVNYYDGSSTVGYNNPAARGLDAAGAHSGAGRPYSPYADLQRGEAGEDYYEYDRASSNRKDPFGDSHRWSG